MFILFFLVTCEVDCLLYLWGTNVYFAQFSVVVFYFIHLEFFISLSELAYELQILSLVCNLSYTLHSVFSVRTLYFDMCERIELHFHGFW